VLVSESYIFENKDEDEDDVDDVKAYYHLVYLALTTELTRTRLPLCPLPQLLPPL
jgi:hypothetical protein